MLCIEKTLLSVIAWFLEVATLNKNILVFVSSNAAWFATTCFLPRERMAVLPQVVT